MEMTYDMTLYLFQEPVKKKGRTVITGKVKEEPSNFLIKPKTKKQESTKKENQAEKSRSVYLITGDGYHFFFIVVFLCSFNKSLFSVLWSCHM